MLNTGHNNIIKKKWKISMVRMITQIMLGLMLLFGTLTITPKAIAHLRMKNIGRGILYIFLSLLCGLFSILAFHYAYTIFNGF